MAVRRRWKGVEAGEAEPGLVPQEDQVGLDGQALFHHAAGVVHVAVERAVGEVDRLHAIELALAPCRSSSAFLMVRRIGTAPYIEYWVSGKAST